MITRIDCTMAGRLALLSLMAAGGAGAQDSGRASANGYPAKPVRVIVPLAPGGGSDIVARIVAAELLNHWGQSVVVDNRPGGGSTVGTAIAAKAPADGYTLLVSSSSIAISPALYKNLDFDIQRDFSGITLIASQPSILAVHASVPAGSVRELVALAKAQPGKLTYASAGTGSATHLGAELLRHSAGIDLVHVPYKSAGQATSALLSGESQLLLTNMASVLPHMKSGRIKALGISAAKRSALAPTLPTVAEGGIAGFEYSTWYAMLAPAGTPKSIVNRIQTDLAALIRTAPTRDRFVALGMEVYGTTAAELEAYLHSEIAKWSKVIRAAGVRAE
jgi:tripartite-type tricarboxylate transporter receptor subunit TctC